MLLDQMYKYFQTPNANNQIALTKKKCAQVDTQFKLIGHNCINTWHYG